MNGSQIKYLFLAIVLCDKSSVCINCVAHSGSHWHILNDIYYIPVKYLICVALAHMPWQHDSLSNEQILFVHVVYWPATAHIQRGHDRNRADNNIFYGKKTKSNWNWTFGAEYSNDFECGWNIQIAGLFAASSMSQQ